MKKTLIACGLFLLPTFAALAQKKITFRIPETDTAKLRAAYSGIEMVDARNDTADLGFSRLGFSGKELPVVAEPSLRVQLRNLPGVSFAPDSPVLVLLLRQLAFAEEIRSPDGRSYADVCTFTAHLYEREGNHYQLIGVIDTLYSSAETRTSEPLRSFVDTVERAVGATIRPFLNQLPAAGAPFFTSVAQIRKVADSIDKSRFPLYTLSTLRNGLYDHFRSFVMQTPDVRIDTTQKARYVSIWDEKKERFRPLLPGRKYYALVKDDTAYVLTSTGARKLIWHKGDLAVTGTPEDSRSYVGAAVGVQFGLIGGLIGGLADAAINAKKDNASYYYIFDPLSGIFYKGEKVQ